MRDNTDMKGTRKMTPTDGVKMLTRWFDQDEKILQHKSNAQKLPKDVSLIMSK